MEFRILGPLEVLHDGRVFAPGGIRERTLLALLVLSPNKVVSSDRLAEDLWAGRPPDGAARALRVYVSRLRKSLRDFGGDPVVITQPPGYLVRMDADGLDARRFEVLVAEGRARAAGGDHATAAATLREALALWRGPALAGLTDAPFARVEAARLDEIRLGAVEERLDAELRCGLHAELVAELDTLTRAHPLRERLWAQRMLALYRSGRQADALRAFQEVRTVLAGDLGLEPGAALTQLERAMLRHDPELDWAAPSRFSVTGNARPGGGRTPFVGRHVERANLRALLDGAAAGTGALMMIGGEPGVGKTRLTEELMVDAGQLGFDVFAGHCYEAEGAAPYVAVVEILETALARAPTADAWRRFLGEEAPEVAKLVPKLRRLCPDIPPPLDLPASQARRMLFNSLRDVVEHSARHRPLLLILDDLHWADDPTLLLVEHLAEGVSGVPVLMVATYRDTEVDVGRPLATTFEDLRRRHLARWMHLSRLPEQDVADMVRGIAGQDVPAQVVDVIYAEAEGNPFFVEEVYRHLTEEDLLFDADGRFRAGLVLDELEVPAGVRLVLGRRLQRLRPTALAVLTTAAVVGRTFSVEVLEAVDETGSDDTVEAIEDARRARLILPADDASGEDRFIFAHELIRQTLIADLSLTRRRRLHAKVADALERRYAGRTDDHAAAIAHHLFAARASAHPGRIFRSLVAAGRRAMSSAAFEEALREYERALAFRAGAEPAEWAAFLFELGMARRSTGRNDTAIDAWRQSLDVYEELGDRDEMGRVGAAAAYSLGLSIRFADAVELCQRGLSVLGEQISADRARLLGLGGTCLGLAGSYHAGLDMIDQEIAIAGALRDDGVLGDALRNKCILHWGWLEHEDSASAGLRAADLLRSAGDLFEVATSLGYVTIALVWLGRVDDALALVADLEPLAERVGSSVVIMQCRRARAMTDFFRHGDPARLETFAHEHLDIVRLQGLPYLNEGASYLGLAAFLRGDWPTARVHLEEAQRHELIGALKGWEAGLLFECLAYSGDKDDALALLDHGRVEIPSPGQAIGSGPWCALFSIVEGLTVLGARDRAADLYEQTAQAIPRTRSVCAGYYDGRLVHRAAGIAALAGRRWDRAETHFQAALAQAEAVPHRPEAAHTRRWYGRMLLERDGPGDRRHAETILSQAVQGYEHMGMPRHRRLAAGLLESRRLA